MDDIQFYLILGFLFTVKADVRRDDTFGKFFWSVLGFGFLLKALSIALA